MLKYKTGRNELVKNINIVENLIFYIKFSKEKKRFIA